MSSYLFRFFLNRVLFWSKTTSFLRKNNIGGRLIADFKTPISYPRLKTFVSLRVPYFVLTISAYSFLVLCYPLPPFLAWQWLFHRLFTLYLYNVIAFKLLIDVHIFQFTYSPLSVRRNAISFISIVKTLSLRFNISNKCKIINKI